MSLGRNPLIKSGGLSFSSDFDSGNCWKVYHRKGDPQEPIQENIYVDEFKPNEEAIEAREPNSCFTLDIYEVWVASDCQETEFETKARSWFHFKVEGGEPGKTVWFKIMNVNPHEKLYDMGMRAVWRPDGNEDGWEPTEQRCNHQSIAGNAVLTFPFTFPDKPDVFICFTYPYTYERTTKITNSLLASAPPSINSVRTTLCHSVDGHSVDVITVTSSEVADPSTLPIIVMSARVHPCETPASYILEGFLEKLLTDGDETFEQLRRRFVFYIVPCLNPDGVARGHCRNDVFGRNLNRLYASPNDRSPTIAAFKTLFVELHETGRLHTYLDLHAHHSKRGWFFYGNNFPNTDTQVESQLLPKILSIVNCHFDYDGCNFSKSNMMSLGGKDGTKEGSARVSLYQITGLTRCYTIECNFNTSSIVATGGKVPPKYTPFIWREMGADLGNAMLILQLNDLNAAPAPLLASAPFATFSEMREQLVAATTTKKEKVKKRTSLKAKLNPDFVRAQQADGLVVVR
eukprot:TRINITY_DN6485_c0_g2_i1.p1 TRINITY_DN6485_c0_g2~~TRINITY_DN6485_c0_g2_i1.p1  ORF type:complete len:534 (+),score=84.34 TRINITY_DN6485_c0_g2_i1:57-1604(+)